MVQDVHPHPSNRVSLVRWVARMGAVTAEALAYRERTSVVSARARLVAAERHGLVSRRRPLSGQPALYVITTSGLGASGLRGLGPCRVSPANAVHLIACASVAVVLESGYPEHTVLGERELRRRESEAGGVLASARLGDAPDGRFQLHRPDLVLFPVTPAPGLPVAVEVELTIKAPRRLEAICRAWARARHVAGVLYLAPPDVERALKRAIARVNADERIVVAPLAALCADAARGETSLAPAIPVDP